MKRELLSVKDLKISDDLISQGFFPICLLNELTEKSGKKFIINETEIAVFKVDEKIYVMHNICPHQHSAIIYDGFIEDCYVVCPAHGWQFNLETGKLPKGGNGLQVYQSVIENGIVAAKVFPKQYKW